jgi:hypothetical protein
MKQKTKSDNVTNGSGVEQPAEPLANRTGEDIVAEINSILKGDTENILRVGALLCEAKERKDIIPHGEFGNWVKSHFSFSERTSQKYMAAHRYWSEKVKTAPSAVLLQPNVLYALAAGDFKPAAEAAILEAAKTRWVDEELAKQIADDHTPDENLAIDLDAACGELLRLSASPVTKFVDTDMATTPSELTQISTFLAQLALLPRSQDAA